MRALTKKMSHFGIGFLVLGLVACQGLEPGKSVQPSSPKGPDQSESTILPNWISSGDPNLQHPCREGGRGTFPDVFFFRDRLWCAIQDGSTVFVVALAKDLNAISVRQISLPAGTLAFPKFGKSGDAFYLAHSIHNNSNNSDEVVLLNLDTNQVENLGQAIGVHPVGLGFGSVAWTTPAGEVRVRSISGGTPVVRIYRTSQGIARLVSSTQAVTGDENRTALAGGFSPCWAGNFVGLVPPEAGMFARLLDSGKQILFWELYQAFDPRCTEVPGGYAISAWGPSNFVGLKIFRPADFN
jgi:hypothetical protein